MSEFDFGIIYSYLLSVNAPAHVLEAAEALKPKKAKKKPSAKIILLQSDSIAEISVASVDGATTQGNEQLDEDSWTQKALIVTGAKCLKCGSSERYSCNSRCVKCTRAGKAVKAVPEGQEKKILLGRVCVKCGDSERYRYNNRCVTCAKSQLAKANEMAREVCTVKPKKNGFEPKWDFSGENIRGA